MFLLVPAHREGRHQRQCSTIGRTLPVLNQCRNCPGCFERDGNRLQRKSRGTNQQRDNCTPQQTCQTGTPATPSEALRDVEYLISEEGRGKRILPLGPGLRGPEKGNKPRIKRRARNTTLSGRLWRAHGTIQTDPYREILQQAAQYYGRLPFRALRKAEMIPCYARTYHKALSHSPRDLVTPRLTRFRRHR